MKRRESSHSNCSSAQGLPPPQVLRILLLLILSQVTLLQ